MRIIMFLIFLIISIYSVLSVFGFISNEVERLDGISSQKTFEEKIKVPKGMEKEYSLIMSGKSPFQKNTSRRVTEAKNSLVSILNTGVSFDTKNKPIIKKKNTVLSKDKKPQHKIFKTKLKKYFVSNDNLFADIIIYNNSNIGYKGFATVSCSAYNDNLLVDKFKWSGDLLLNSKKAILLKDTDFGYISMANMNNIWCYVSKFKIKRKIK